MSLPQVIILPQIQFMLETPLLRVYHLQWSSRQDISKCLPHPSACWLAQMPFLPRSTISGSVDSILVRHLCCPSGRMLFPHSVRRPETIPGRVAGGLYTGNVAPLLHWCSLRTRSLQRKDEQIRSSWATPLFSQRNALTCAVGSGLRVSGGGGGKDAP